METLSWKSLLSDVRRKDLNRENMPSATKGDRTESERDFDRIVFSSATRKLANKTQVFPLDPNDTVRTRLTHSFEVSNLARSVGMSISFNHAEAVFGDQHHQLEVKRRVPALLAAIGLAHDQGNPPFGHQGEQAIKHWFLGAAKDNDTHIPQDFKNFDGNPQTFRILTRLQILNDDFGLNLTCGTLAALIKYPCFSDTKNSNYNKFGIFKSEKNIIEDVWEQTGLRENIRHPLTYILEACDDIAYSVLDAEDTVKKQFASFYDLMDHLDEIDDSLVRKVVDSSRKDNKIFKKENLSSSELNEISMQKFRVYAIYHLVTEITSCFVENIEKIMNNEVCQKFKLINDSKARQLCDRLKEFDSRHGFKNPSVLELELNGENLILETMDLLWSAIKYKDKAFSSFATSQIPESYRRVKENSILDDDNYKDYQLLCDTISGLSDSSLINLHDRLRAVYRDTKKKNRKN